MISFFFRALFTFFYTHVFFQPSSVSLSYFILAVPMRECLGNHSCMSSLFPVAIPNGTSFFSTVQLHVNKKQFGAR